MERNVLFIVAANEQKKGTKEIKRMWQIDNDIINDWVDP